MKVLFCHNYYQYRGGEDQSFESEVQMLRDAGVEVITFVRNNADIPDTLSGKARIVAGTIYSRSARKAIASLIQQHQPDVMHCNNLFPQISTSIYGPALKLGVPIVQAIRNYRTFCANSFFYRDERVCTDCLKSLASFASIRHGCYRESRPASAVVTAMQLVQRTMDRIQSPVSLYFAPSEFARQVLVSGGFAPESICVKPNFIYPDPGFAVGDSVKFVFAGRLSREKGLHTLMQAWREIDAPLSIVGDGPLRDEIISFAANHPAVTFHGELDHKEVIRILGRSRSVIMPSLWFETFGRTIAEAFSCGTPVIASRLGAMAELVDDGTNGYLFQPGSVPELVSAVKRMAGLSKSEHLTLRAGARNSFENRYSRETNLGKLIQIYSAAIESAAKRDRDREKTPQQ